MKKISNLLQTSLVLHHKLGHVRNFSFSVSMMFFDAFVGHEIVHLIINAVKTVVTEQVN